MFNKTTTLVDGYFNKTIKPSNRTLQFGDGLFETCVIKDGQLLFWHYHYQRLKTSSKTLGITAPVEKIWLKDIQKLSNKSRLKNAVVKLTLSRGQSERGYIFNNIKPIRIASISPLPKISNKPLSLKICPSGYGNNVQLAGIKHCNRLDNVLASRDLKSPEQDCLMCDDKSQVISTTKANIFLINNDKILTPDLSLCGIAGTRQSIITELAKNLNMSINFTTITLGDLYQADEVFVSNSLLGIHRVASVNDQIYTKTKYTNKFKKIFEQAQIESNQPMLPEFNIILLLKWLGLIGLLVLTLLSPSI